MFAQSHKIPMIESDVVIDGNLDDSAWINAYEISDFYNKFPLDTGLSKNQMIVKLFHNKTYLYVSAIYYDNIEHNQMSSLKRDDIRNLIGLSDSFALVLDPFNQGQHGYYFAMNMGSAQADALIEKNEDSFYINSTWSTVWEGETKTEGQKKIYEMKIPLKSIGYDKNNSTWGILIYSNNIKVNRWISMKEFPRNYRHYDLRFRTPFIIELLENNSASKLTVTPSITNNYHTDMLDKENKNLLKPSIDAQYNLTSSLKLDVTVNPDFSQIDVDQQVVNLTRFAVNFPEVRSFFLENSDLFSNLGTAGVNPFYSRKIGQTSDIKYGLKLSGNLAQNTRLGVLNVQTKEHDDALAQNYSAAVVQQKLNNSINTTGFYINRQQADNFNFEDDYNRILGLNINYKSENNKWTGLTQYAKSITSNISDQNNFYHFGAWYNNRNKYFAVTYKHIEENYITDVGFVPRLQHYDPINDIFKRESYKELYADFRLTHFPKYSSIDQYRYLFVKNNSFLDAEGNLTQSSTFLNNAIWFKNRSSIYLNVYHEYEKLKYSFDLLKNDSPITPGTYNYIAAQIGYNSIPNNVITYNIAARYGSQYDGNRTRGYLNLLYRIQPYANIGATYELNNIDLNELGEKTFHLINFKGEIFFSNRLNWTTYLQYNSRNDNFNINSRVQWEYKPLSYVYLVVTDNYTKHIDRKNWAIALKTNLRLEL